MIDYAYKLKTVKEKALSKNGLCLSEFYIKSKAKLKFICEHGHEWTATYNSVVSKNTWCKECYDLSKLNNKNSKNRPSIKYLEEAKDLAKKRNGIFLGVSVSTLAEKHHWKCGVENHSVWSARLKNIREGQWCPQCGLERSKYRYNTESKIRLILETYFGFKLEPARPSWNRNPLTQYPLELDGYNDKHKVAFEHDGEHHFETGHFSRKRNKLDLTIQKYKDFMKKKNCSDRGIMLINIPIPKHHHRKKFFVVLRHVIDHCKTCGTFLTFSFQQIREMKSQFEAI